MVDTDFPDHGSGTIDLALSEDDEIIFSSYDGPTTIDTVHARSMDHVKTFPALGEAAGMAFDSTTQRLFAARRDTDYLDVYFWESFDQELICGSTYELQELDDESAYDLSLDGADRQLYISSYTPYIYQYDISGTDPCYVGSIYLDDGTNTYDAVGMDFYDGGPGERYLYAGAWVHRQGHPYLVRVDLDLYATDPCDSYAVIAKDIGAYIVGVAVDPDTGLIYVTTHRTVDYHTGAIEVYDTTGWNDDPNQIVTYTDIISGGNLDHPAGIMVGPTYKPSLMYLSKSNNVDPCDCADPNTQFSYSICYGGDPNEIQTNTTLIDYLPDGVTFESADPCNVGDYYDEDAHAFIWNLGSVPVHDPNDPCTCVTLTVRVNEGANPLGTLVNKAVLESDDSYSRVFHSTDICERGDNVIFVDVDARVHAYSIMMLFA